MARIEKRAARRTAFLKARMRDREEWREVMIGNVSTSGLMIKCQGVPRVGTDVEIRRRGMIVTGRVVWALPTRFGLRSFEPIDVESLTAGSGLNVDLTRSEEPARRKLWHWRSR